MLKTLDSIEAKVQQVKTSFQELYMGLGLEKVFKSVLDWINQIAKNLNKLSKMDVLLTAFNAFRGIKSLVTSVFTGIFKKWNEFKKKMNSDLSEKVDVNVNTNLATKAIMQLLGLKKKLSEPENININANGVETAINTAAEDAQQNISQGTGTYADYESDKELSKSFKKALKKYKINQYTQGIIAESEIQNTKISKREAKKQAKQTFENTKNIFGIKEKDIKEVNANVEASKQTQMRIANTVQRIGDGLTSLGSAISIYGLTIKDRSTDSYEKSKVTSGSGNLLSAAGRVAGSAASGFAMGGPWGALAGALGGLLSSVPDIINGVKKIGDGMNFTLKERYSLAEQETQDAKDEATIAKSQTQDIEQSLTKLRELEKAQYNSNEAQDEYIEYMNQLADSYPGLVENVSLTNDAIISAARLEEQLAAARELTAQKTLAAATAEYEKEKTNQKIKERQAKLLEAIIFRGSFGNGEGKSAPQNEKYFYTNSDFQVSYTGPKKGKARNIDNVLSDYRDKVDEVFDLADINISDYASSIYGIENTQSVKLYYTAVFRKAYDEAEEMGKDDAERLEIALKAVNDETERIATIINSEVKASGEALIGLERNLDLAKVSDKINSIAWNRDKTFLSNKNLTNLIGFVSQIPEDLQERVINYALDNLSLMEDLFSEIDITKYSNINNLRADLDNIAEFDENNPNNPISIIRLSILQQFMNSYNSITSEVKDRIQKSWLSNADKEELTNYFDLDSGKNLITGYSDFVDEILITYDALINQGLEVRANNLIVTSKMILSSASKFINDEDQASLLALIRNIDFTDFTSVSSLIQTLTELDSEKYADIIIKLQEAQKELIINSEIVFQNMLSATKGAAKNIEDLISNRAKGFDFSEAIEEFEKLNNISDETLSFDSLFKFDEELQKWVYTTKGFDTALSTYKLNLLDEIDAVSTEVEKLNNVDIDSIKDFGKDDIQNIESILFSEYQFSSAEIEALENAFLESDAKNFGDFWEKLLSSKQATSEAIQTVINNFNDLTPQLLMQSIDKTKLFGNDQKTFNILLKAMYQKKAKWDRRNFKNALANLDFEGLASQGYSLTAKDRSDIISSRVQGLQTALTEFSGNVDTIVSEETLSLIELLQPFDNYVEFDNNKIYTVQDVLKELSLKSEQIPEALNELYHALYITTGRTLADINSAAASIVKANNKNATNLNTILNSTSISIDSLQQIFTDAGQEFAGFIDLQTGNFSEAVLLTQPFFDFSQQFKYNPLTQSYDIIAEDFETFLNLIGSILGLPIEVLKVNSAEYKKLYSSFVENNINRKTEIKNEVQSQLEELTSAKIGDLINLSYLDEAVIEELRNFGIIIDNGIAQITGSEDIYGAIEYLSQYGSEELASAATSLLDKLQEMMKTWADAINKGLNGSLTVSDTESLKAQFGLTDLDFSETKNGLKMSRAAAIDVYNQLLKIDAIQAKLTFDALSESLKNTDEYRNISDIIAHISDLTEKITNIDNNVSDARKKEYQQELSLAKEILRTRSLTDPDSFNFMDNKIPDGMQGPQNYWNAVGEAYKAMNTAASSGYMEIQDFYNIVNEMNNLAAMSGEELTFMGQTLNGSSIAAADLITKGMSALSNIDGEGVKINLSKLGADFDIGAQGMGKDFDKAVKSMATSQIKMLDAAINMLEAIVALEDLGNIDTNSDNKISFDEIFKNSLPTDEWIAFVKDIKANDKAMEALKKIGIYGHTLDELLTYSYSEWESFGITEDQYAKLMSELRILAESGDFDPENLLSIFDSLGKSLNTSLVIQGENGVSIIYDPFTKSTIEIDYNSLSEEIKNKYTQEEINNALIKYFNHEENNLTETEIDIIKQIYISERIQSDEEKGVYKTEDGAEFNNEEDAIKHQYDLGQLHSQLTTGVDTFTFEDDSTVVISNGVKFEVDLTSENPFMYKNVGYPTLEKAKEAYISDLIRNDSDFAGKTKEEAYTEVFGIKLQGNVESEEESPEEKVINITFTSDQTELLALFESDEPLQREIQLKLTTGSNEPNGTTPQEGTANTKVTFNNQNIQETSEAIDEVINKLSEVNNYQFNSITSLKDAFKEISEAIGFIEGNSPLEVTVSYTSGDTPNSGAGNSGSSTFNFNTGDFLASIANIQQSLNGFSESVSSFGQAVKNSTPSQSAIKQMDSLSNSIKSIPTAGSYHRAIDNIASSIKNLPSSKKITVNIALKVTGMNLGINGQTNANISLTQSKGNIALASGNTKKTLVGELGRELVVSNGKYYTVGDNGAEFVDLPSDAIVFNHLQTEKLLGTGKTGRGKPIKNEKTSVAYAGGNVNGPAMASARQALEQLKEIRAMWQSLLDASASQLGALAGNGSGGGGGGGGSSKELQPYIADVERWYNLERQIAHYEDHITREQAKRKNLMDGHLEQGYDYLTSLKTELNYLKAQQKAYQQLADLQKDYYERRREDLLKTSYSKIFTYDEYGLMQYVDGKDRGLDILATINKTDEYGRPEMSLRDQINYLTNLGFSAAELEYDTSGKKTENKKGTDEYYEDLVKNFNDRVDAWRDELDSLYDSVHEGIINIEENQSAQLEILQEIVDNEVEVENATMQALEDSRQAVIDGLQKQADILQDTADKYSNSINEALNKEKQLYQDQQTQDEVTKLQRQLAILQRTGGSSSEIKNLQNQLDSKLKDSYFNDQQKELDAVNDAVKKQVEQLQTQIDILTESLEYQKETGLIWNDVRSLMENSTAYQLADFIESNTAEIISSSALQREEEMKEILRQIQIFIGNSVSDPLNQYLNSLNGVIDDYSDSDAITDAFLRVYGETRDINAAQKAADEIVSSIKQNKQQPQSQGQQAIEEMPQQEIPQYETFSAKINNPGSGYTGYALRSEPSKSAKNLSTIKPGTQVTVDGYKGDWWHVQYGSKTGWITKTGISLSADKKSKLKQYKTGGLIDETGPIWVDGTKKKPEGILNAEQLKNLKSLTDIDEIVARISTSLPKYTNLADEKSEINIGNLNLNFETGVISNDYDSRRVAKVVTDELVRIARHSGTLSVNR